MSELLCKHCDRPAREHHQFEPVYIVPPGCLCDGAGWRDPTNIPPVCQSFGPMPGSTHLCVVCEHSEACHKGAA